ncbi:MAG: hypothetical protein R2932_58215 [Caldilineaceae bacterium]
MSADASIAAFGEWAQRKLPTGLRLSDGWYCNCRWRNRGSAYRAACLCVSAPHTSHFCAKPADVIPIPAGLTMERKAVLLPAKLPSTLFKHGVAVGEWGRRTGPRRRRSISSSSPDPPLAQLTAVDRLPLRRERAHAMGVAEVIAAPVADTSAVDLVFELTGNPDALNDAIALAGYNGRVLIGSWYGQSCR